MTENVQFKCSGDCLNCRAVKDRRVQWQYCAAQFSYNALRTMQSMQESLNLMSEEVKGLKEKIEAIQNCEAEVFDPNKEDLVATSMSPANKAQKGDGVEKVDAPKEQTI